MLTDHLLQNTFDVTADIESAASWMCVCNKSAWHACVMVPCHVIMETHLSAQVGPSHLPLPGGLQVEL